MRRPSHTTSWWLPLCRTTCLLRKYTKSLTSLLLHPLPIYLIQLGLSQTPILSLHSIISCLFSFDNFHVDLGFTHRFWFLYWGLGSDLVVLLFIVVFLLVIVFSKRLIQGFNRKSIFFFVYIHLCFCVYINVFIDVDVYKIRLTKGSIVSSLKF